MADTVGLTQLARRPQQSWNVDGLPELVLGVVWIVWGAAWLAGRALPPGPSQDVYRSLTPFLLVASGLASAWALKKAKERVTLPRAGYVAWPPTVRWHAPAAAILGMIAVAALVIVNGRVGGLETLAAPAVGCILGVGLVVAAWSQRTAHLLVLGAGALVLGFSVGAWRSGWDAASWLLVVVGTGTALAGTWRLRSFLRRNPAQRLA